MNIAFITRTSSEKDLQNEDLLHLLEEVRAAGIQDMYVISDFDAKSYTNSMIRQSITVVKDKMPISPISMNTALRLIEREKHYDYFFVCSKEIAIKAQYIKTLIKEIQNNKQLLVIGYKFTIEDKKLNKELQNYYNDKDFIAYQVPWNTCAMWNYNLFDKYIKEFDKITLGVPTKTLRVCIDNVCHDTHFKGMEDGLAIAKAASQSDKPKVYFKLLDDYLPWKINNDYNKKLDHRKKLARKDIVMRGFMKEYDFKENDLKDAKI
jgi:hypothetical protein